VIKQIEEKMPKVEQCPQSSKTYKEKFTWKYVERNCFEEIRAFLLKNSVVKNDKL